jgi:hypothetical protein
LSGLASEIRMAENDSGSFGFSKKLKMSFTSDLFSSMKGSKSVGAVRRAGPAPPGAGPRVR